MWFLELYEHGTELNAATDQRVHAAITLLLCCRRSWRQYTCSCRACHWQTYGRMRPGSSTWQCCRMPLRKQPQMPVRQPSGRQQRKQTAQQRQQPHHRGLLAAGRRPQRLQQLAQCWCQGLAVLLLQVPLG